MKKVLSLALCAILTMLTLTACGKEPVTAKVIEIELTSEEYAFGVDKQQPELLESVNKFIAEIKADGTFEEICNNYFGDGTPVAVTSATYDANKDQLVVATNAAFEPFEFMEGENYYGIDLEIAAKLAEYLGQELVIQNMDFDAVCLAVGQQKCDIAMAGLTIDTDFQPQTAFLSNAQLHAGRFTHQHPFGLCHFPFLQNHLCAESVFLLIAGSKELDVTGRFFIQMAQCIATRPLFISEVPLANSFPSISTALAGSVFHSSGLP